jgi:predicted lipoprotein with Yx(FWY)xxD motif
MIRARLLATLAAAAAAAAACGGSSDAPRAAAATGTSVTIVRSQFGRIIADGRGHGLYDFSRERGRSNRCYGACARAWPPVTARSRPSQAAAHALT